MGLAFHIDFASDGRFCPPHHAAMGRGIVPPRVG